MDSGPDALHTFLRRKPVWSVVFLAELPTGQRGQLSQAPYSLHVSSTGNILKGNTNFLIAVSFKKAVSSIHFTIASIVLTC